MSYLNNLYLNVPTIVNILFFIVGLAILIKGSDLFIDSAIFFAKKAKVSETIIGLTLVSMGTSLPELATNINSAIKGRTAVAIGNIAGSNITNIALIVGVSALILGNIYINKKILYRDTPIMILTTIILLIFSYFFDKNVFAINRVESIILVILMGIYIWYLLRFNKEQIEQSNEQIKIKSIPIAILFFILGLAGVVFGSDVMVDNILIVAKRFHISDGVIGATIVAIGTSLPELAVSFIAIIKKKHDLSIGNVVGSNIFNILFIIGITGIIRDVAIINAEGTTDNLMLFFTLPVTLGIAILFFLFSLFGKKIGRIKGLIFLLLFIGFIIVNYMSGIFLN
ncbi:MAG TPA: calcium/sodium antiporter [Spirochaetota bacterium]|nr:calcium/sodium antiporter [Spirochaetota bacterium]HOL57921.1 calcium/sodium antiporter [Spirochaetota bacterium]HPP04765.1 calcium/sodium antiporter [Spirochaetota bacterium]